MNKSGLPHQYPFLFVDCIVDTEPGKWARGYKLITENDWFITESQQDMPFSIMVESLAQVAAFTAQEDSTGLGFLSSVKKAECIGRAVPGDKLDLYFEVARYKRGFLFGKGMASVNGTKVAEAELGIFMESGK
ncbi:MULTISPECIES: 3-hydroxyacyl-ACP dehydratase FabZ family protein [unclassified Bacillus (in: firmicutes)]|uniref:3-hydroxyacyl-ACP dehydratase FabZ family protein n=1 Tax=unclassified Bacillus (in: firmicutes) TaxID=185979 RepID=UPI0004233645|nr:3-hydroxyacyl-ACP dehydratase FabZ family protein [Bacillus sp. NSP9.1]QHZ48572.1 beta-hydroxyacyl-ACP dehydratase [Bacillus sp. NSP9.1]